MNIYTFLGFQTLMIGKTGSKKELQSLMIPAFPAVFGCRAYLRAGMPESPAFFKGKPLSFPQKNKPSLRVWLAPAVNPCPLHSAQYTRPQPRKILFQCSYQFFHGLPGRIAIRRAAAFNNGEPFPAG